MVRKNKLKFLHLVRGCIRVLCHTLINAEQVKCTLYTNYIYYAKPYSAIKTTMKKPLSKYEFDACCKSNIAFRGKRMYRLELQT